MSMDSLGFDFSGSEFLDISSWGNSTPLGSSPTNGGLPFSVGTPTGVQSLGDEPFASLPAGHDDFNFMDSPKAMAPNSVSTSASGASNTTTKTEAQDDFSSSYFGGDLDTTAGDDDKHKFKAEDSSKQTTTSGIDQKLKDATSATSAGPHDSSSMASFVLGGPGPTSTSTNANATQKSSAASTATNATSSASVSTSSAPSSTNASTARPHIDGAQISGPPAPSPQGRVNAPGAQQVQQPPQMQQQQQQQQPLQRYPSNQMMVNQPGQQPANFAAAGQQQFGMAPGAPMGVAPGQPAMQPNGQYMQQPFRPATSTYDEEMMRVKSMMMQHPDLIPPPMEVLRISMAQSTLNQGMMGGANYMQRVGPQGQMMNRLPGAPGYPAPYGAPPNGMMMPGQPQPPMMDPRMRGVQPPQPQRPMPGQTRTPGGTPPGGTSDSQTAWQSENDLPLRRKMIGKIVSLLQQRKPDAPTEWIRRLPDMARRLEDSLYRTAKNRDEYGDFTSLKTRLQHLAVTMGARAQHKAGVNPRPPQAVGVPGVPGVPGQQPGMMGAPAVPQAAMAMNPVAMQPGMAPQPPMMGGMPFGNVPGRMTQQQMLQQQQQMQLQMQQNPQMRQQFTPQQLQQYQAVQMQRRQFQMQQQQQAMQRQQTAMQGGQPAQQQPQQAGQPGQQQFQGQTPQQQTLQRQNSMRQQPGQAPQQQQQQLNQQRPPNANYMQQPGQQQPGQQQPNQAQNAAQQQNAQLQRRNSINGMRQSTDLSGLGGDSNDFLNIDLSQSFMGTDDLSMDGALGGDLMKSGDPQVTGVKRTLSLTQQQMAAAANAAAFKRSKSGAGPGSNGPRGSSPHSPSQSTTSQANAMAKPVQGTGGASKTPPMSAVNAK